MRPAGAAGDQRLADAPGLQQLAFHTGVVVVEVGTASRPKTLSRSSQAEVVHQQPEVGGQCGLHIVADVVEFDRSGIQGSPSPRSGTPLKVPIGEYSRSSVNSDRGAIGMVFQPPLYVIASVT